jgi:sugar phosphate isomerase/epimerase
VKLMPDLFHMNIEDASFRESFEAAREFITYVHVADSNRLAPGWGHLPFDEIFSILSDIGYQGYLTVEILPRPDPDSAARQAIRFLSPRLALPAACTSFAELTRMGLRKPESW